MTKLSILANNPKPLPLIPYHTPLSLTCPGFLRSLNILNIFCCLRPAARLSILSFLTILGILPILLFLSCGSFLSILRTLQI